MEDYEPTPTDPRTARQQWPRGRHLNDDEVVGARCPSCRESWRIHKSMCGFRLRCSCGGWIPVPAAPAAGPAGIEHVPRELPGPTAELTPTAPSARRLQARPATETARPAQHQVTRWQPDAADQLQTVADTTQARARHTDRTLLEWFALLVAIIGPHALLVGFADEDSSTALLVASSISIGLVVLLLSCLGNTGREGLRGANPIYFAEALVSAAVWWCLAYFYISLTENIFLIEGAPEEDSIWIDPVGSLGLTTALLVIAVTPALVEELAFRGVLQGRLQALLGRTEGFLLTALAFAVVHLQPLVLPLHFGIGLYLGWLRMRCGSLYPCMLLHFTYNAMVITLIP